MSNTDTAQPTTPPSAKRGRVPLTYRLVAVGEDEKGEIVDWNLVPQPKLDKENPSRSDYKRAVRKALENGENAEHYNGKQLAVISFPKSFCFKAKTETVEIRKVNVTEA